MKVAQTDDAPAVISVLALANHDNPSVLRLFKTAPTNEALERLFKMLVEPLIKKGFVYTSENGLGIAVIYPHNHRPRLRARINKLKIALQITGLKRSKVILRTQKKIDRNRKPGPHLYFWMLGVDPSNTGLETIIEIRDFVFLMSKEKQVPILAETPMIRTKVLYERYGFMHYDTIVDENGLAFYLLERP